MTNFRKKLRQVAAIGAILFSLGGANLAHASGPPKAELHVWGGNEVGDSSAIGLRSVEVGVWATKQDRIGLRYDNSLSLDNPALARQGIDAEGYFASYLHDFNGKFLLSGEVGKRDLPDGAEQKIYKGEAVIFRQGAAIKLGAQASPTDTKTSDFTDTVAWGQYNFPVAQHWRLEPGLYVAQTGATEDREWRAAAYAEYTPSDKWQLGVGAGYGEVDSDIPGASGSVVNAHARVTLNVLKHQSLHFQVRYEDSPQQSYTIGLVGVTFRLPRG